MAKKVKIHQNNNDVKGIVLVTAGILMLISVFSTETSGIAGKFVKKMLITAAGLGAFIFPALIIFIGFCYIAKKKKINFSPKFYGIMLFLINTLLFIQMTVIDNYYIDSDIQASIRKLYQSDDIIHAGIIGMIIDIPLMKLFGKVGCYVIFISLYIISIILMSRISIYEVVDSIRNFIHKDDDDAIKLIDEEQEGTKKSVDSKREKFIKNINSKIKILNFMKSSEGGKEDRKLDEQEEYTHNEYRKHPINIECASDRKVDAPIPMDDELSRRIQNMTTNTTYEFPNSNLLNTNSQSKLNKEDKKELIGNASKLEETLLSFGVEAKVIQVSKGPSVTRFEIQPSPGVKVSKIVNLADDIALGLASSGIRIEAPIPGKSAIGIEVPNRELTPVYLREVIESPEFKNSNKNLAFCLGKDIAGNCVISDLSRMPHMLIAGSTGSGKSVCINTLIISLVYKYSPDNVKLLMIDPKVVELSIYNGIPHLLIPVVTDPKKAAGALNWAVQEMKRRYKLFAGNGVRSIESYNELAGHKITLEKLPFVVIIIDELADLMMVSPHDVEDYVCRLAQMARAAGMHLVIATQRPSVDVITGVIKANIPSRISFAVSSQIDSRTILDSAGAEKLLGKGDMLFYPVGESKPIRIQGAFISEGEVERVVSFIKSTEEPPSYQNDIIDQISTSTDSKNEYNSDELLQEAINIVVQANQASTSLLQRKLRIGYNRAARIIDQMEANGIISARDGSKPRKILIKRDDI
ncbi:DNA translocase FtsK [Clostridium fermenticellae]|uniref:DNA translocase FtsK n=1 Tax=Clostridium fermenticellae TaxID=2068654 RepID=A0A386H2Z1_9CLOT|nr:DNA translocase FtsK [Clostridium fermenticellae]AYD40081.1 DNA translocase FtsK [Clostridium fermenticellae]